MQPEAFAPSEIDRGVIRACTSFTGARERWSALSRGASDEQIRERLAFELGSQGGTTYPDGFSVWYSGGARPQVRIGAWPGRVIADRELIVAVRRLFGIPDLAPPPSAEPLQRELFG